MNIGGKTFDASPALIPIAFEITVLVAGVGTVVTLLVFRDLLPGRPAEFSGLGATDDKFLLVIDGDPLKDISILTKPEANLALIMKDGKIYKNTLQ